MKLETLNHAKVVTVAGQKVCSNCKAKLDSIDINLRMCSNCNSQLIK